jgi:hypothetical protein
LTGSAFELLDGIVMVVASLVLSAFSPRRCCK